MTKPISRPDYQALDGQGLNYVRAAQTISELPLADMHRALEAAAPVLADKVGKPINGKIKFGLPLHIAFGMTRPQAKNHPMRDLLLTPACDLSLDYCPIYEAPRKAA